MPALPLGNLTITPQVVLTPGLSGTTEIDPYRLARIESILARSHNVDTDVYPGFDQITRIESALQDAVGIDIGPFVAGSPDRVTAAERVLEEALGMSMGNFD